MDTFFTTETIIYGVLGLLLGIGAWYAGKLIIKYEIQKRDLVLKAEKERDRALFALTVLLGAAIGILIGPVWRALYLLILLAVCYAITVMDMSFRIIPNRLVIAIMAVSAVFAIPYYLGVQGFPEFNILQSLIGFVVCFAIFSLPAAFSKKVGAGDIKLAAAMGFALGLINSLVAVVIMGILVTGYVLSKIRNPFFRVMKEMIPMGPFITAGMIISAIASNAQLMEITFRSMG